MRCESSCGCSARLPRREQDVVALCDWSGLSYEDAAAALDIPIGTGSLATGTRPSPAAGTQRPPPDPKWTSDVVPLRIEVSEQ